MSELRKANTDLAYFLTFKIVGWIDVFTRKELSNILIKNLQNAHAVAIYCYVIMSNHIHLIAQKKDEKLLSDWVRDFKSVTAKEIVKAIRKEDFESRRSQQSFRFVI
jgi:putative transposase